MSLISRLPEGITSKSLHVRDLDMHMLQAGSNKDPLVLLLHGFPELAFSWRHIMLPLAAAGFFVVAPDLRGYGRTVTSSGPDKVVAFEDGLESYGIVEATHDVVALVSALGFTSVAAVMGHDYGSPVAASCALVRPDLFKSVVCMSAPYPGPPALPFDVEHTPPPPADLTPAVTFNQHLATLDPPLKHYTIYYAQPTANAEMTYPPQGLHDFLRAYYHVKSADWPHNDPHPLREKSEVTKLPHYYVMPYHATMPEAVLPYAPSKAEADGCTWLSEADLDVYVAEYSRTGFQGGLNAYRAMNDKRNMEKLRLFSGKKIEVPAMFLGGAKDWGVYQSPGALDSMKTACARIAEEDVVLVAGAGHWVQQEQASAVTHHLLRFLQKSRTHCE